VWVPPEPADQVLGGVDHLVPLGRLGDFLALKKRKNPVCPHTRAKLSGISGGKFVQPFPTLKENEGSNSSER
jgi:hypothetical protein